eukprot:COSAG02_NODE_237_length_27732_cov_9.584374_23_plen_232_part_01
MMRLPNAESGFASSMARRPVTGADETAVDATVFACCSAAAGTGGGTAGGGAGSGVEAGAAGLLNAKAGAAAAPTLAILLPVAGEEKVGASALATPETGAEAAAGLVENGFTGGFKEKPPPALDFVSSPPASVRDAPRLPNPNAPPAPPGTTSPDEPLTPDDAGFENENDEVAGADPADAAVDEDAAAAPNPPKAGGFASPDEPLTPDDAGFENENDEVAGADPADAAVDEDA